MPGIRPVKGPVPLGYGMIEVILLRVFRVERGIEFF